MFTRSLLKVGKAASATLVESRSPPMRSKAYQVHDAVVSIATAPLEHVRLSRTAARPLISPLPYAMGAENAHFNTFG